MTDAPLVAFDGDRVHRRPKATQSHPGWPRSPGLRSSSVPERAAAFPPGYLAERDTQTCVLRVIMTRCCLMSPIVKIGESKMGESSLVLIAAAAVVAVAVWLVIGSLREAGPRR